MEGTTRKTRSASKKERVGLEDKAGMQIEVSRSPNRRSVGMDIISEDKEGVIPVMGKSGKTVSRRKEKKGLARGKKKKG